MSAFHYGEEGGQLGWRRYRTIMGPSKMTAFRDGLVRKEGQCGRRS